MLTDADRHATKRPAVELYGATPGSPSEQVGPICTFNLLRYKSTNTQAFTIAKRTRVQIRLSKSALSAPSTSCGTKVQILTHLLLQKVQKYKFG
jgi:hypothetical protein